MAWSGFGRRLTRLTLIWVGLTIIIPLVVVVTLAIAVGGWVSIVIAIVSWLGLAVVASLVFRFGLRTWRPVKSLIETAGRLADGDHSARVDVDGPPPVRPVVQSFNRMAEQLERAEVDRRRLLADVGHELRTPLTVLRGELEAIADGVHRPDEAEIRRLLGDIGVMERLLDDLQTLSTAEAGMLRIHREPTDVVQLANEVAEGHRADAVARGVAIVVHRPHSEEPIDAEVDPVRVREIMANVVANGVRAAQPGGTVDLTISSVDHHLVITVADSGLGIAADDLERVFDRFHKGPGSDGTGLGLTITRNLVEAHGGDISLESEEGVGTIVTIRLPSG